MYILSNEAMPGIYKIGMTHRNPEYRAEELNTTGVPVPFIVEYCIYIDDYMKIESIVHRKLKEYRFGKEFFNYNLEKCILCLKETAIEHSSYKEKYRDSYLAARVEGRAEEYLREQMALENRLKTEKLEREKLEKERILRDIEAKRREELKYQEFKYKEEEKVSKFSKWYVIIWSCCMIALGLYFSSDGGSLGILLFLGGLGVVGLLFAFIMGDDGYYMMRGSMSPDQFDKWARKKYERAKNK